MDATNPFRTIPRSSIAIFLLSVFFIFVGLGFVGDIMDMGRQPTLRIAISVVISGFFAVGYTVAGVTLRSKFWKACLPLFALQFACNALLIRSIPDGPHLDHLNVAETARLQGRLIFDGLAVIASICLGYTGLVYVSRSEGRRHLRSQMEKAALDREMAAAREVQRVMVPENLPHIDGYAIESVYLPAAEVGGDFFQVIPLKSGRTLSVIGDVSGKGLSAAMIVSMIVGTLRAVSDYTEEPAEILAGLNRRLCGRIHDGFATCLIVRLEDHGALTLANAGHLPPYMNGTEVALPGSLPLGLDETAKYQQTKLEMAVSDVAVFLTDGVPEAQNEKRELLGFSRVESMLQAGSTARAVAEAAQQHGQNDDITVLRVARVA
ncbi:MAG: PP2C family protein-serine/threonine phosphatase [Terracidiphilus sp.]